MGGSGEEIRLYLDALDYIASQLSSVSPVSSFYHFTISLFSYFFMIMSRGHRPIFRFIMIMMMIKMTRNDDMMIFHDTYHANKKKAALLNDHFSQLFFDFKLNVLHN